MAINLKPFVITKAILNAFVLLMGLLLMLMYQDYFIGTAILLLGIVGFIFLYFQYKTAKKGDLIMFEVLRGSYFVVSGVILLITGYMLMYLKNEKVTNILLPVIAGLLYVGYGAYLLYNRNNVYSY